MPIRNATYKDADFIKGLLNTLGYSANLSLLIEQLEQLFGGEHDQAYVYEHDKEILGFVTVHFLPQLAFDGGVAIISYLAAVDHKRREGVATALEQHVTNEARARKCERIQVHCLDFRTPAHQFYLSRDYKEYPKYFTKRLIYGE